MKMPFGKYKGEDLLDVPVSYLEWFYDNVEVDDTLNKAISDAIDTLRSEHMRRGRVPRR